MKRLVIAAFIFGMATGYLGALWQICAQKSLRAKYETGNMKYEIAAAEAGTRGSGAEAHARQEMSIETGKDLSDGADGSDRK